MKQRLLLAFALWAASVAGAMAATPWAVYERVRLVRVVDGDTVRVDVEIAPGLWVSDRRCRFLDVDAPELSSEAGRKAGARLAGFLAGKKLRLEAYGQDRYGRWLVRIQADGKDVSTWLVEEKLAEWRKRR